MKQFLFGICMLSMGNLAWGQTAPPLGSARSFAVLGNTTVTNTGATLITGDLGVSPGTAVTGFPPGIMNRGATHSNDAAAIAAQIDVNTAYTALSGQPITLDLSGSVLGLTPGAISLTPGVYHFGASALLTGTLTLNGNGIYVFQIGSALTTSVNSSVVLTNGAKAENVFWQVGSSTTIGVGTAFVGSIFALASNTLNTGSSVDGHVFSITGAVTMDSNVITAPSPAVGRWEIVHITGDSSAQTAMYPGSFSTFLKANGSGYTYGTFTNSMCVIDAETFNVVPTWTSSDGIHFVITITVDNLGLGNGDFSFIYTGIYDPAFPVPGGSGLVIPAISGNYSSTGDVSSCSASTGTFTATFLPTISSGVATGALDSFSADNGRPFTTTVGATINFIAPPAEGQLAGTVTLDSNPTFGTNACFAASPGVTPLTINPNRSSQSGTSIYIFAEGVDPQTVPTTLFLNGASVNLYNTPPANTDANATQMSATQWAASAAIGEDNQAAGSAGVINDGTNNAMAFSYGVIGGACDTAGGVDAPFFFLSGKPIVHKHKKPFRHGNRHTPNRERGRTRDNDRHSP